MIESEKIAKDLVEEIKKESHETWSFSTVKIMIKRIHLALREAFFEGRKNGIEDMKRIHDLKDLDE